MGFIKTQILRYLDFTVAITEKSLISNKGIENILKLKNQNSTNAGNEFEYTDL